MQVQNSLHFGQKWMCLNTIATDRPQFLGLRGSPVPRARYGPEFHRTRPRTLSMRAPCRTVTRPVQGASASRAAPLGAVPDWDIAPTPRPPALLPNDCGFFATPPVLVCTRTM